MWCFNYFKIMKIHHFCFNPFQENSYILYDETKECVLIDQSPTLNHGGPPDVHQFCTPAEGVKKSQKK